MTNDEPKVKHLKEIATIVSQFSIDHYKNIQLIVEYAGKYLNATTALYNRELDGKIVIQAKWNAPSDMLCIANAAGHMCADVISKGFSKCIIINNLQNTSYYDTDPNVSKYRLHTYAGYGVPCEERTVGSLCVLYDYEKEFTDFDKDLLQILGTFVGIEEDRISKEEDLFKAIEFSNALIEDSLDMIIGVDCKRKIVKFNNAAKTRFGYSPEDIIGHDAEIIYASKEESERVFNELKVNGEFMDNVINVDSKGNEFTSLLSAAMFYSRHGEYLGTVGVFRDITEKLEMEAALLRRDKILQAVSYTADRFIYSNSWKDDINDVLREIGEATDVSRVYVFKSSVDSNVVYTHQKYEWCKEDVTSQLYNSCFRCVSLDELGFSRWFINFMANKPIVGNVKDFPEVERQLLRSRGVKSILVIPIILDEGLWGFMGFDECRTERFWTDVEIDALKIVVGTFTAGIHRDIRKEFEEKAELERWQQAEKVVLSNFEKYGRYDDNRESKQQLFKAMTLMKESSEESYGLKQESSGY